MFPRMRVVAGCPPVHQQDQALPASLGRAELDDLLAHRDDLNSDLQSIINARTEGWGIDHPSVPGGVVGFLG